MRTDPVTLQIVTNSLLYASEEMGLSLRNSAFSPNIKERMDHSAAVFDHEGRLLAQAEHIPVHLGSLPWGLKNLIEQCAREGIEFEPGSMVASNDPYIVGTHLNDVTVTAPIHQNGALVAFAVNKAHHADVGGVVPGSISMEPSRLSEEGFVLEPTYLWRRKGFVERVVNKFAGASRTPSERRGDLKAQVAANNTGMKRVTQVIGKYGLKVFLEAAEHSIRHSEEMSRRRIGRFRRGTFEAEDFLESPDGGDLKLNVKITISPARVEVDYAGTSRQVDYPLNAVFGVTVSGVYFVLRCLLGDDIPANHGAFSAVKIAAPRGSILNPTSPHPVGAGNVETSQRNADVLFRAMAKSARGVVPAASGGSMNNVMIGGGKGNAAWAFYETIGVGLGGGPGLDGVDGIQANMTNTMNTPLEEIERSLPIRMVRYEFRPDSSGAGTFRGGSGIVRAYLALKDRTTFTVVAEREVHHPWGASGGRQGGTTKIILTKRGRQKEIPCKSTVFLDAGDVVEIRTAGGGGFGSPRSRDSAALQKDLDNGLISSGRAKAEYRASHYQAKGDKGIHL